MRFTQSGGQTATGPADSFTGTVYIDGIRNPDEQSTVGCAHVRFTPGARTAWHKHCNGQTLHVTEGVGLTQVRGGDIVVIQRGDTIWCPPDEWHWHGAAPDRFMTHLALWDGIHPDQDGPETRWGDHVTDDEYHQR